MTRMKGIPGTSNIILAAIAELLFVVLPLLVVGIVVVLSKKESVWQFMESPEWAFGAAVLMGQGVVKFVGGMPDGSRLVSERIAVVVAAVIVLGLVPSLTVLAVVLHSSSPSAGVVCAQVGLFFAAICVFIALSGIGHHWRSKGR